MPMIKPGLHTTEFWMTAVTNVAGHAIGPTAALGLASGQESTLWLALLQALALVVIPLALALVNSAYIAARAEVKKRG
ncbi:MAG: hypothetical protein R3293_24820 [Candidatus Promineifilaceae bacterium]|nr:hypothetical protein [Candidatus Promineifilaceae bacterium]